MTRIVAILAFDEMEALDFAGPFEVFTTAPEPQNKDVVVLTLTEDTLAQFPYRSPVDRAFLAELIRTVDAAGARAIGFDVLFDQPTEPEKDAALAAALPSPRRLNPSRKPGPKLLERRAVILERMEDAGYIVTMSSAPSQGPEPALPAPQASASNQ